MAHSRSFAWIMVSLLSLALSAPLQADITPDGDVDPTDYSWWTGGGDSEIDADIGKFAYGSVTVDLGSVLSSGESYISAFPGSTGEVTVDGSGSTWTNSERLFVGYGGHGTLNITNGGSVACIGSLSVGYYGNGTLNVTNGGSVSNTSGYIGSSSITSVVTIDGIGSTWTNSSNLFVGPYAYGQGTLDITNGGSVSNSTGYIGYQAGSTGEVTVAGGSTWTNGYGLSVGRSGQGTLNITNGGTVISSHGYIGYDSGSTGEVTVDGSGSTWTNSGTSSGSLYVGREGRGTLNIINGGAVSSSHGYIGCTLGFGSVGVVTVDGSDSTWTNSDDLYVGGNPNSPGGTGELTISNGGQVTTDAITNWKTGKIVLGVSGNNMLIANGDFTSNGTVRLTAGAGLAAGTYTPIFVGGNWLGAGGYEAFGGLWDADAHTFTAAPQSGDSGEEITVDLSEAPRLDITDSATGYQVGASFAEGTDTINFTATAMTDPTLAELTIVASGEPLSGWNFDTDLSPGEEVLLSFNVGSDYNTEDLEIWHYDNAGNWTAYDVTDLVYAGGWVSFTVDGFSGYAVTNIPEPASAVLLLSGGILAMLKRRSHRTV